MNLFAFMGRLTKDPSVRYTQTQNCVADFDLAVDRWGKTTEADFFRVTTFGKTAEFVETYLKKGTKVVVQGRVQNNNYTDKEGRKVYGFQFLASQIEFAESKKTSSEAPAEAQAPTDADGFMNVPDGVADAGLPFN